jgi:two-component system response regulator MprA
MKKVPKRPLILLVDDDLRAARGLALLLTDDGFEVERAVDGASAIARLSRGPVPDVLITDFYMPHADGLAVTRFARSRSPAMPTIVVTGHAELVAREPAAIVPALVVLVKPVDYDVLTRTLRTLLPVAA